MNRALIAFSITICLILAASDARAFSSGPADYGAAFINGKLLIFGRLAQGLAWSGLQPAEQAQVFGYRCYDSRNSIWKTVGSRTMSGLRVMLLADMKCVKEQDYCADPNKAPEKAARASFPLYAACRPVLMNPSAFICEIDSKDVPALCELNSLSPERKIEQLFDGERFDLRIVFVGGKGGALAELDVRAPDRHKRLRMAQAALGQGRRDLPARGALRGLDAGLGRGQGEREGVFEHAAPAPGRGDHHAGLGRVPLQGHQPARSPEHARAERVPALAEVLRPATQLLACVFLFHGFGFAWAAPVWAALA